MPVLQTIASPPAFRLDGRTIVDGSGVDQMLREFERTNEQNYTLERMLSGKYVQTHRLRTYNSMRGPSGVWQHRWTSNISYCDDVLFPLAQRIFGRPILHSFHDKLTDYEFFDGDGATVDFFLSRPLLSTAYTQVGGIWANTGGSAVYVVVTNLTFPASIYPVVYGNPPVPGAGEVGIYNASHAYGTETVEPFRHLLFNAAPPNTQGVIEVAGWYLYMVAAHINTFKLPSMRDCTLSVAYDMELQEL